MAMYQKARQYFVSSLCIWRTNTVVITVLHATVHLHRALSCNEELSVSLATQSVFCSIPMGSETPCFYCSFSPFALHRHTEEAQLCFISKRCKYGPTRAPPLPCLIFSVRSYDRSWRARMVSSPRESGHSYTLLRARYCIVRIVKRMYACILMYVCMCIHMGTAVAQWLKCCATNRKVVGLIPAGVTGIFHWHKILPIALWPWGRLSS